MPATRCRALSHHMTAADPFPCAPVPLPACRPGAQPHPGGQPRRAVRAVRGAHAARARHQAAAFAATRARRCGRRSRRCGRCSSERQRCDHAWPGSRAARHTPRATHACGRGRCTQPHEAGSGGGGSWKAGRMNVCVSLRCHRRRMRGLSGHSLQWCLHECLAGVPAGGAGQDRCHCGEMECHVFHRLLACPTECWHGTA